MSADNQQAAHWYANRGWPVFVLSSTKSPLKNCDDCDLAVLATKETGVIHDPDDCDCLTCHAFYAGTTDHDRIDDMFRRHPFGLIALRTGAPSGTVVVDIDLPKDDEDDLAGEPWVTVAAMEDAGILPPTLTGITGSGGFHLIYAHPGYRIPPGNSKLAPHIDIKADGSYIVLPPSIHPTSKRPYRWEPVDVTEGMTLTPIHPTLADALREKPPPEPRRHLPTDREIPTDRRLHGLIRKVLEAPQGKRNDMLFWAAKHAGEMVADHQITEHQAIDLLEAAGAAAGLSHSEMVGGNGGTIASGLSKGMYG